MLEGPFSLDVAFLIYIIVAPNKASKNRYSSYLCTKTYVAGTHRKRLGEALLMSTHNICFHAEITKVTCGYPLLSGDMQG